MIVFIIAIIWGFAEATVFFIVPDVILSYIAIKDLRKGMIACIFACTGALIGGTIMYYWGANDALLISDILSSIPGISHDLQDHAFSEMEKQHVLAILFGPLSGTPYKLFASQAHAANISFVALLLISVPARLIRFMMATYLAHWITKHFASQWRWISLSLFWLIFYTIYFSAFSN